MCQQMARAPLATNIRTPKSQRGTNQIKSNQINNLCLDEQLRSHSTKLITASSLCVMSQNIAKNKPQDREQIGERGRQLAQYVQDLYASGARLWTKDMFRDIEAELAKEPKPHAIMIRSSKTIPRLSVAFIVSSILTVPATVVNGVLRRKQVPPEGPNRKIADLRFL